MTLPSNANQPESPEAQAEMEKYGITRKSVDHFFHGEYRYTTFRDALAQAKRMADKT